MKFVLVLNDPPYGSERCYNGLRLANALVKRDLSTEISVFLMGDAVACAKRAQKTADGYYNIESMLRRLTAGKHSILLCGTCMDARGLVESELVEGARRSSMDELAQAVLATDKAFVF